MNKTISLPVENVVGFMTLITYDTTEWTKCWVLQNCKRAHWSNRLPYPIDFLNEHSIQIFYHSIHSVFFKNTTRLEDTTGNIQKKSDEYYCNYRYLIIIIIIWTMYNLALALATIPTHSVQTEIWKSIIMPAKANQHFRVFLSLFHLSWLLMNDIEKEVTWMVRCALSFCTRKVKSASRKSDSRPGHGPAAAGAPILASRRFIILSISTITFHCNRNKKKFDFSFPLRWWGESFRSLHL